MAPRGELDTFLNDILDPRLASCKNNNLEKHYWLL